MDDVVVTVTDLLEDERWPEIGPALAAQGVRAVLGVPLRIGGVPVGSVNVYHHEPRPWDDSDRAALCAIEGLLERLLAGAIAAERQEVLISQLRRALESRVGIERAVGVVMAIDDVDAVEAFERIRRAARSSRRPVHDVASDVVLSKKLV